MRGGKGSKTVENKEMSENLKHAVLLTPTKRAVAL